MPDLICDVDTSFDRDLAEALRHVGALEDSSFDDLDQWDQSLTRFRDQIASHTGESL